MVALAILLALVTPFLAGVFAEADSSSMIVRQAETDHRNQGERDSLLFQASKTDQGIDKTPFSDSQSEFPKRLDVPAAFKAKGPRKYSSLSSGEVWDLQGRVNINTVSPQMIANLLGLSASLKEEVLPDGDTLAVDEAGKFPLADGMLLVDGEVIPYERRDGNVFTGCQRTLIDHTLPEDVLVLDYRPVVLVTSMYDPDGNSSRDRLTPYSDVKQVNRITKRRVPGFTEAEMDVLLKHCTTDSGIELAARWGKSQRVFTDLDANVYPVVLRVKSALGFGAGTLVRIRSLENDTMEYALVAKTTLQRGRAGDINLQTPTWQLVLLRPLRRSFTSMQTLVEPLVRHPININTAEPEVLVAMLRNLRRAPRRPPTSASEQGGGGRDRSGSRYGPKIGLQYAKDIVNRIVMLRRDSVDGGQGVGPFIGWEDLCTRLLSPLGAERAELEDKRLVLLILQNWLTGRTAVAEMATAPISFTSASLVEYRVAQMGNKFSLLESARRERHGIASVIPSQSLDFPILTQDSWEECFRLSRRVPGYITYPINVGQLHPWRLGDDPSDRSTPYLWARLWSDSGLGEPRYPNRDLADVGVRQAPAIARPQFERGTAYDSFLLSRHPEGHDVTAEGAFELLNSGPASPGGGRQRRGRHKTSFPITGDQGMPLRYGIHFWAHPRSLVDQALFEAAGDLRERNLISLRIEEGHFVFEILDEAGLDPDVRATRTQVERTAGQIRVPIAELNLKDDTPIHFNFAADGTRPGQMSMMIDGVPRKGTRFRTFLTREIPEYKQPQTAVAYDPGDKGHYLDIHVEDAEHFPDQGVVRIGRELFEYTGKDGSTLYCKDLDTMGGRKARMRWYEFRDDLEVDNQGRPTKNESDMNQAVQDQTPAHPEGTGVELYGYSAPIYRNTPVSLGSATLRDKIGAFAVGRGFLKNPEDVAIPANQGPPVRLGRGLMDANREDIELANPLPDQEGKGYPPDKAENRIYDAFPESGGFALLVQRPTRFRSTQMQAPGTLDIGGVEVIRYGRRKGHILSGIQRGVQLPNLKPSQNDPFFDGKARIFVTDWDPRILQGARAGQGTPVRELAGWVLYVVPISLPVNGSLTDPTVLQWTEWAQIYPKDDENKTEWVRYDVIVESHLVRAQNNAYRRLCRRITGATGRTQSDVNNGGGSVPGSTVAYDPPDATLIDIPRIGYVERVENDFPVIYQARRTLEFRGDPRTNTTPHEHAAGTTVLPTHRLELDRGSYGGLSARAGRNDRVAFVGGTQASGGNRPPTEWHSVNHMWQRHEFGAQQGANANPGANANAAAGENLGPYPFQIIGLKAQVKQAFVGAAKRDDFRDTRQVDRVVKFPSGELPAAYVDHAKLGGSVEYRPMQGLVDELVAVWRRSEPLVLVADMDKTAKTFTVHQHMQVFPWGTITVAQDLTQLTPNYGGLVMIDDEILAYNSHAGGVFQVAENGRGLLDTEARAHGRGSRVHFLRHLPAAILAGGVSENSHQLVVNNLGNLPRVGGTLLMGQELLHYSWTVGNQMVEMPIWREPVDDQQGERVDKGLFRGRYGTVPQGAAGGEVVIWFPHRYWDRFHERADDPEMAYAQVTLNQNDVFYQSIRWKEENPDEQFLDLRCYVRVDGLAPFDADPAKDRMLFLFKEGEVQDKANAVGRQGSVLEARFVTEYRPGAFDPENFLVHAWKLTPTLRDCFIKYQGETRILKETVVQR